MSNTRRIRLIAAMCVAATALPASSALAQGPARGGYAESNVLAGLEERPAAEDANKDRQRSASPSGSSDRLPFTGLDAAILAALGAALAGTGLVVRRGGRAPTV